MDDNFKLKLLIDTLFTENQKFLFLHQSEKMVKMDNEHFEADKVLQKEDSTPVRTN